ncbi:hypothetical protein Lalb_Chr07g0180971 [Lupinus albus]|uniref:Uncharacterized protein n=1 Tax=Lupinus albus TaxID=3870 RepID=A0A6A4Q987_LUPAL|nr:hypothetical protein Lalb_Chr07g0180971 [Lupinus albus]
MLLIGVLHRMRTIFFVLCYYWVLCIYVAQSIIILILQSCKVV